MTDIQTAIINLKDHSICLCKDGKFFTDDSRGISPMLRFEDEGIDLRGFSCADIIVGKAAAMLFVNAGIVSVHGKVMSQSGKDYLTSHGISCTYETLTDRIIDRTGKDTCPMEKAVAKITDAAEGCKALRAKLTELRS